MAATITHGFNNALVTANNVFTIDWSCASTSGDLTTALTKKCNLFDNGGVINAQSIDLARTVWLTLGQTQGHIKINTSKNSWDTHVTNLDVTIVNSDSYIYFPIEITLQASEKITVYVRVNVTA